MKRSYDCKADEEFVAETHIRRAQQDLWVQLRGNEAKLGYLTEVAANVRSRLDLAFQQRVSTSLLVIGPKGSGKKAVIDSVLQSYARDSNGPAFSVARIQGQVCSSDQDALCSIAGQLCLRPTNIRELSTALEDLEDHFRQCALNGRPSVIVLQDVHTFATREKQVLIYTLLDYMHKSDMLFVVLGCTPCAHLQYMLEKRVLSRLNAQFVFLPQVSAPKICTVLAQRLQLELIGSDEEKLYRKQFNSSIVALFGDGEQERGRRKAVTPRSNSTASILAVIQNYVDWGKGLSHFLRSLQLAVCRLSREQPYLTKSLVAQTLFAQNPCTLMERLATLPLFELHIFASVARLQGRLKPSNIDNGLKSSKRSKVQSLKKPGVRLQEVAEELDNLIGTPRRNENTKSRLMLGLSSLIREGLLRVQGAGSKPEYSRILTDQALLLLQSPMYEVRAAFQVNFDSDDLLGREIVPLVLSDRIRRAVLEPLENVSAGSSTVVAGFL